ncbi:MAG: leucine--tRNA ligase [Clostridia bacterium]|nr:leucine--tRNA ligase [Clostridia bacterium]
MYNHKEIEAKWAKYWEDNHTFKTDITDFSRPKYYVLDMFPYPSGQGLHVGHPEGYTATDILSRMKRMQGYNVLHPMGFDSFGLPSEQYAINTGNHPGTFTRNNVANFTRQLKMLGFDYDWDKTLSTCESDFYRWTQWIFMQLYKDGYAYYKDMPVNWCEELGTVLSNDEVIDGKSERGGFSVVKKNMRQLVMNIPAYAEKLLAGLDEIDWPESTKEMQRNWIGKSNGAYVDFKVAGTNEKFTVFTTRADTLFGATYCVMAPEHALVEKITTADKKAEVDAYLRECAKKSDMERTDLAKDKTGVFIGAYAINPVNDKQIPIYISDYVLASYGTGAIMAVPAHDDRDYDFAKKFNIDIIQVIDGGDISEKAYTGDGVHINSGFLNGLNKTDAIDKITDWLSSRGLGKKTTTYRLREWIFARQRYWGEPVPIVNMDNGEIVLLTEDNLPLDLPVLPDYKGKNGKAPLDNASDDWKRVNINGQWGTRELNTMPGAAGSSWYFLRYIDNQNDKEFANYELMKHWLPVDLYVGGSEHAVGHLLYSRFWNNYLFDKGLVPVKEPFKRLLHPGMILGSNGEKMSKSRGNVVNPDDVVREYGADSLRLFEMFMGPITATKPWDDKGVVAMRKFLDRIWHLYTESGKIVDNGNPALDKIYNETVKKVTEDFEKMAYNTAISQMMIFLNAAEKQNTLPKAYAQGLLQLLNPVCPFITEELWNRLGNKASIALSNWPKVDESKLVESDYEIVVQVLGKMKTVIRVPNEATQDDIIAMLKDNETMQKYDLTAPKKVIFVKGRCINFII